MKPIDRLAELGAAAAAPITVVSAVGDPASDPAYYTLTAEEFGRLVALVAEGAWAGAFCATIVAEVEAVYENATAMLEQADGAGRALVEQYWAGAQVTRDLVREWLHTDPDQIGGYEVGARTVGVGSAKATILEFEPAPEEESGGPLG